VQTLSTRNTPHCPLESNNGRIEMSERSPLIIRAIRISSKGGSNNECKSCEKGLKRGVEIVQMYLKLNSESHAGYVLLYSRLETKVGMHAI